MILLRDQARQALWHWREVIAAGGVLAFGLWCASFGGFILLPFGLAVAALAAGWGWTAIRTDSLRRCCIARPRRPA